MSETKSPHAGLTRRSFLKTTAAVAGAAAVVGCATPGMHALADDSGNAAANSEEKIVPGRCFYGGCFSCSYCVTLRDGHVVKVTPDPDAPYGRRPCLRGVSQMQRLYSNERINYPMRRVGERGSGEWERISWDEAIDTIASKWRAYHSEFGGQSIAMAKASGAARYLSLALARLSNLLGMTAVDTASDWSFYVGLHRVYGNPSVGIMTTPGNEPFEEDVFNAKTIMMWGHNLSEAYLQRWRYVMEAQAGGAKVVTVDPVQTLTATRSDEWYAPRPASDAALLLAMAQVVIDEGLHDEDYLLNHTVGPYLVRADTGEFLRMSDLGVEPTEGPANPMTGKPTVVDPPVVWDAASGKAVAANDAIEPALSGSWNIDGFEASTSFDLLKRHVQDYTPDEVSNMCELSVEDIRKLARIAADGPVLHMTGMGAQAYGNGVQVGAALGVLLAVTGMVGKPGTGVVGAAFNPPSNSKFLFPTKTRATNVTFMELPEVMETNTFAGKEYPPIKSLFIAACGFIGGRVDMNRILGKIVDNVEFVVCADTVFSDSAQQADIVLPITHHYELEDIYISPVTNDLQYNARIIEPAFEAKTDQEVCRLIAGSMGLGDSFDDDETMLRQLLDTPVLTKQGITLETLREKGTVRFAPKGVAYADGRYPTPTGKVEFYCEKPKPRLEFGQERDDAAERLPRFYPPFEAWPEADAMKKFPFILNSERSRNRWHSQGFEGMWLEEINPEPTIRINEADAANRGIDAGDYVEVFNDRGSAVARAYPCAGIRPGMLTYPKGFQSHQYVSGNFAELTQSKYDPYSINSANFDAAVDIRKWERDERA